MATNDLSQFFSLTPDVVMAGAEKAGFSPTGQYLQLNSYENRVFDLRLEDQSRIIVKYYRPLRWSRETILEEHEFLAELSQAGIPAIAPVKQKNNSTISVYNNMMLSIFPKASGRMPQELNLQDLKSVGRLLAQVHNVGEQHESFHRPIWDPETFGWFALRTLESWISPEVRTRYFAAAEDILNILEDRLDEDEFLRIHGDCHRGNLLQLDTREGDRRYFLVDFDDFGMGPAIQDFWMLLSGSDDDEATGDEKEALMSGYEELRHFPSEQWDWVPGLRGLRIMHYAAWIARRWVDPTFPQLFPQFTSYNYWAEETEALERCRAQCDHTLRR